MGFPSQTQKVYKVSEITSLIKETLENEFNYIQVEGEISNYRPSHSGHVYFSLKDQGAVLSSVMFRSQVLKLHFKPKDGMLVQAKGRLSVYPKSGSYQIICDSLNQAGMGDLLMMIEERKKRLAGEGLFDEERKRKIPLLPQRVAVITSPTGAAVRDILRVLKRRNSGVNVLVVPALVQGDEAPAQLCRQLRIVNLHKLADVIIIGRGGGSLEDLLAFYDEEVVRAIAKSKIPVISAVGHEIDFALSDFAADLRAPTPSAAAEMVAASREELLHRVGESRIAMTRQLNKQLEHVKLVMNQFKAENMERNFRIFIQPVLQHFDDMKEYLIDGMKHHLREKKHQFEIVKQRLLANSPYSILERGYAVVTRKNDDKIIKSSHEIQAEDKISIKVAKGCFDAQVKEIHHEKL
ncbi:MAG: exodeoxyribonuclease VII large subunit [Spirochaetales bacterium]|nr:exodeoxyribonuclease VII large subunit [Spirochaetales bacterium]